MELLDNLKNLFYMKGRTYPIKYDELGQSARSRALELFGKGLKPIEVTQKVEITPRTAHRYYYDWKKSPEDFQIRYKATKDL